MNLIAAMSKNNFLLLLVITILLSSCASSSFFDDNSSNYNDKNDGDCELATNIAFELMDVLFSDNNEEEAEFIYETEEDSIVPYYTAISEDKISLSYVLLKPANFPFPKLHEQLEAKRIITGKINLYETYDDYGEKYFLVEKEDQEELIQVPKRKRKFRKFIKKLTKDNDRYTNTIDVNDYNPSFLTSLIEIYNSHYQ